MASPFTSPGSAGAPSRRRRVLVIDNHPTIALVVHRVLGGEYEIVDVAGADDAMNLAFRAPAFDAILCDLLMPGMSGQEFYLALSSREPRAAARVIFMTGAACLPEVRGFLSSISNSVLEKPFTRAALRAVVGAVSARNDLEPGR